ncbi:family 20 glycosylhydrolase [Aquiflexum lacus]|uniref:family 20 glycosylhydrolase n=1 Tax=Aquiflexum lacus TaxID=2483805 RepID=UPI0018941A75|nr:family 20 glycosylhydrolase [Aquiflexum lacus]
MTYRIPFLPLIFLWFSCQSTNDKINVDDILLSWELEENIALPNQTHTATFNITNTAKSPLNPDWEIYFNTIFLSVNPSSLDENIMLEHLSGDFFRIKPTMDFPVLETDQTYSFSYQSDNFLVKNSHSPQGVFMVFGEEEKGHTMANYTAKEFSLGDLYKMSEGTPLPIPIGKNLFEQSKELTLLKRMEFSPIIPTPKTLEWSEGELQIEGDFEISFDPDFSSEAEFLINTLESKFLGQIASNSTSDAIIQIKKNPSIKNQEGYQLDISDKIQIQANHPKGVFYALQSLLALLPIDNFREAQSRLVFPQLKIEDEPRFAYRGLFLDVARNFQTKEAVLKLLDLMAFYKLNVFHLNLANDEGWRIEIPGLPELTNVGSKRGFSRDEKNFLWPYYGSGPDVDNSPNGTGFYTVSDFEEILKYAHERHIEVIPELGVPGHSRAAIIAMRKRYHDKKENDMAAAIEFLLEDFEDTSEYLSAQNFRGNTLCICQESTYNFYEKIVDEMMARYRSARVPLNTFHTGGDEVPHGAWTASPTCAEFISKHEDLNEVKDLSNYFYNRVNKIFQDRGLQVAGWEEIGQKSEMVNGKEVSRPNPEFANKNFRVYAWNSVAGWGGEDMAYQLANAGYEVIVCNSSNIYFDLAYNMDPDEPGHQWSGYVDLKTAWRTVPLNHFISNEKDMYGRPIDPDELAKGKIKLSAQGSKNIKGIQGQLWTETVKGQDMMEYYLLPKMLGLVERAWATDPSWTSLENTEKRIEAREKDWNKFANAVGQREIPRLDYLFGGFNVRLPKPGTLVHDGLMHVNVETPGLIVRYTRNGTEPDMNSPEYSAPMPIEGNIKVRVFTPSGHAGETSTCLQKSN